MSSSSDSDDSVDEFLSLNRDRFHDQNSEDEEKEEEEALFNIASDDDLDDDSDGDDGDQRGLFQDKYSISLKKDEMASDIEDEDDGDDQDDEDKNLPDAKEWGTEKSAYYSTDYVDRGKKGIQYLNEDVDDAQAEEEEAVAIQKRLVKDMRDADLGLGWINDNHDHQTDSSDDDEDDDDDSVGKKKTAKLKFDVSSMSQKDKIELVKRRSPELKPLVDDFKKYLNELSMIYDPIIEYAVNSGTESSDELKKTSGFKIIKMKYFLILRYVKTIAHYLHLKTSCGNSLILGCDGHEDDKTTQASSDSLKKMIKHLVQFKKLLSELDKMIEDKAGGEDFDTDVRFLLDKIKSGDPIEFEDEHQDDDLSDSDDDDQQDLNQMIQEMDDDDEDRRGITYEMSKNKGLTAEKKKKLRNPRVKHREKFKKAKVRRRGQVREPKKELSKYDGEHSGIKSHLVRSIHFKH